MFVEKENYTEKFDLMFLSYSLIEEFRSLYQIGLNALEKYRTNRDIQLIGCELIFCLAKSYAKVFTQEEKQ